MAMTNESIRATQAVYELVLRAEKLDADNAMMLRVMADIFKSNSNFGKPNDHIKYLCGEVLRRANVKLEE